MAKTIGEYFDERERECRALGLVPEGLILGELEGGAKGRLVMRLTLSERAFVRVAERVELHDNYVHRESYAYYLIVDGQEYYSRDLDQYHGHHGHPTPGNHQIRVPAERISFKDFIAKAWEILSAEEELTGTESPEDG